MSQAPETNVLTLHVFREDDGRYAAEWESADGTEAGMGEYSSTPIGALANVVATLLQVEADRLFSLEPLKYAVGQRPAPPRTP